MNWPLRWYHCALRETWCFFAGHVWKHSWRSRDDRAEREARSERGELTYREENEGNPYCEYSAGWHAKCRRCRLRTRGDDWYPWYKTTWWALRYGASDAWLCITLYIGDSLKSRIPGRDYHRLAPRHWPVVVLLALVAWLGKGLTYFTVTPGRAPLRWLDHLLLDAEYNLMAWCENRWVRYRWIAPRPELENSIGFWIGPKGNPDMTITVQSCSGGSPE